MDSIDILKLIASVLALAIAIIGHEIMHGYIAYKYKDYTAKNAGRLSINPLVHVDLVGTIIVPAMLYFLPMLLGEGGGFLFGWAKPVPVNIRTVVDNGGYNAAMQVSLAGIVFNFTLAAFASIAITIMPTPTTADSLIYIFLYLFVIKTLVINVVLGVFNLIPIPQFDGAHFIQYLAMKLRYYKIAEFFAKYEPYGMLFVLILLMTPLKDFFLVLPVQMILNLLIS
jgi:Zn-dependent protease